MNRIKEVLADKGIKQTWLAEKLGKSYNMVNSYVQKNNQDWKYFLKLQKFLMLIPKN